jgi:S-adenosyl-L-methionine hydrolase (adenosine-forming)
VHRTGPPARATHRAAATHAADRDSLRGVARYDFISFTTDYGLSDGFVAACHGVLARLAPHARVIDVTHLVPPGEVAQGAIVLAQTVPHLPPSVHVAVVDPGVGTARRAVVVATARGLLVGPDNGLLPAAADALGGIERAVLLDDPGWHAPSVSSTFHGRDVFAPVAARLASGEDPAGAGSLVDPDSLVRLPDPVLVRGEGWLEAEVTTVDRFGNVQLAAPGDALDAFPDTLSVGGLRAAKVRTFANVRAGELMVYVDSAGRVAIAVNGGRAVVALGVTPGDVLRIAQA